MVGAWVWPRLILGITDSAQLESQFSALLAQAATQPILIVCRGGEVARAASKAA